MLQAVSHVANSLGHLKTKYVKYLETLCAANGIDIQQLKNSGSQYETLEIFFGGFPVLVGLKYFQSLKVLKIFGQNISSLKPLTEISGTLEELWICEGQLKELAGAEKCTNLKKLYLYENEIIEAGQLRSLNNLEVLHLEDNNIQNLSFAENLHNVTYLNLGSNKLSERELSTISFWPKKLQTLDVSNNIFGTFKAIFTCCSAPSLRYLYVNSPGMSLRKAETEEELLSWLAYHFRFLENLDGDYQQEMFASIYLPKAETLLVEKLITLATLEENFAMERKALDKSALRIEAKLSKLCEILEKLKETLPTKDAKREIVKRVLEVAHSNIQDIKPTKKKCRSTLSFLHELEVYNISLQLESSGMSSLNPPSEAELATLTHFLNFNCSMKHNYSHCAIVRQLRRNELERLCFIEKEDGVKIWTERELILLLDHHYRPNYRIGNVRVFRDVEFLRKEAKEKATSFFHAIFVHKPYHSAASSTAALLEVENLQPSSRLDRSPRDDTVCWRDLHLVALVVMEIQFPSHLHIGHLRYREKFDENFEYQLKKLKEMNISVEIKEDKRRVSIVEPAVREPSLENMVERASKTLRVKDALTAKTILSRCSTSFGYDNCFTVRNPVEICLAYGPQPVFTDFVDLQTRVTILDISSLKITKLVGIEAFCNLKYLSLRGNKLLSLKKLESLSQLVFLDASHNKISKIEQLPDTLVEINLSINRISSLLFCNSIQSIERLNLTGNYIRSLKGLESCTCLCTFMVGSNLIKERSEMDYLIHCTKLWLLDLTANPVASSDGLKAKLVNSLPCLLTLNRQMVAKEQRPASYRCGRGLSLEFIEKCYPDYAARNNLIIMDHHLEIIVFESALVDNLSHITTLNLSKNQLHDVKHLAVLPHLQNLNLSSNQIRLIFAETEDFAVDMPFSSLQTMDLSQNGLTTAFLPRLGLKFLKNLKNLMMQENQFTSLHCQCFDLKSLEYLDVSGNVIKSIKRHTLQYLKHLDLSANRLKEIDGLATPSLETLNVNGNRISTCAALTILNTMPHLINLDCRGNPVIGRRVFTEFVKTQAPQLTNLNDSNCEEISGLPDVRVPAVKSGMERSVSGFESSFGNVLSVPERYAYTFDRTWGSDTNILEKKKTEKARMPLSPSGKKIKPQNTGLFTLMVTGTRMEKHQKN